MGLLRSSGNGRRSRLSHMSKSGLHISKGLEVVGFSLFLSKAFDFGIDHILTMNICMILSGILGIICVVN